MSVLTLEGERRKAAALDAFEAHRRDVLIRARRALLHALLEHGEATADVVRDAVELPLDVSPMVFGAAPTALARAGIIARTGYANTERAEGHARPISIWRLVDRDAALAWLAENPEPAPIISPGIQAWLFDSAHEKGPDGGDR